MCWSVFKTAAISAITVSGTGALGFDPAAPTTSTSAVTFNSDAKVNVISTPAAPLDECGFLHWHAGAPRPSRVPRSGTGMTASADTSNPNFAKYTPPADFGKVFVRLDFTQN